MIPWVLLDTADIPGGGALRLKQRGSEFSIMLGQNELMNSRLSGSEIALSRLTAERLTGKASPHWLIGGLGMGFTLRAALTELGPDAVVTVAELVPSVIAWAKGPMAPVFGACLDDPRVRVHEGDVGALMRRSAATYDAILLDVDNGPEGLTRTENDRLYEADGLQAAKASLRPGGILAVWSSGPSPMFARRLTRAGFSVEELRVRADGRGGGARHTIWLGRRA